MTEPTPTPNHPGAQTGRSQGLSDLMLVLVMVVCSPPLWGAVFEQELQPFLAKHCLQCHNASVRMAEIRLDNFEVGDPLLNRQDTWRAVLRELRAGRMPPEGNIRPTSEELTAITEWIADQLEQRALRVPPNPGRVTARRLNRTEYNNTIRDWLGLDLQPAKDFPLDDTGYGFDNIGDVLSLSPLLMEKYLAASEKISRQAIVVQAEVKPTLARYLASRTKQTTNQPEASHTVPFSPEGILRINHPFPEPGEYEVRVRIVDRRRNPPAAEGEFVPVELPAANLAIRLDGRSLQTFHVPPNAYDRGTFDIRTRMGPGTHLLEAVPLLDSEALGTSFSQPVVEDSKEDLPDRPVFVDALEIRGPFNPAPRPLTDSHRRILMCGHLPANHLSSCAETIIRNLTLRAYRRPASEPEMDQSRRLVKLAQAEGEPLERAIQLVLQALLVSPHFLFRFELDPEGNAGDGIRPLNSYELASRLSYFLWSSLPDDELFGLAAESKLVEPQVLRQQVRRMLRDPKAEALVENFAGQWLQLRNLEGARPDPDRFPDFDDELRKAMVQETEFFFRAIMQENRSLLEFLQADYTFLNQRLARHYGHSGVNGEQFRRIELRGNQRGGVITQASVLTVSSYPTRTSPVLRGKWVLENILGAPPPPPPVMETLKEEEGASVRTLRQRLEKHRSRAACAACHRKMDALGFGLENYDAVGAWRTVDGRAPVDASGELPGGRAFRGPGELKSVLINTEREAFVRCITEKMLTYALGRGLEPYDRKAVDKICQELEDNEFRFSQLVLSIASSLPFQMRKTHGGKP